MPEKPRVAFAVPRLECGGVEMFLLRLCPHLRRRGYDVEVITTEERGNWFQRMDALVPTRHIERANLLSRCVHPLRVGRRLSHWDYDVLFPNGDPLTQQSLTMLPDRVVVAPIIHSDRETTYRIASANADAWNAVVGVSPRICKEARRRLRGRPVVEILHGVELPTESAWAARSIFAGSELRLLYLGRIVQPIKNVMILPEVLSTCRASGFRVNLTVAGEGPDKAALKARVSELRLSDRVEFAGEIPPERVYPLLLEHHALILPSFSEGLPLALIEAQACGCVPIASRLEGISTVVIEDGRSGCLVPPGDARAFAAALGKLYANPEQWATMSVLCHARAAERFSIDRMVEDYANLIDDAVAGRYPLPRSRRGRLPVALSLYWRECVPPLARQAARRLLRREPLAARGVSHSNRHVETC